jgi:hypothetical protein
MSNDNNNEATVTPVVPEALPPYWRELGYREVVPHIFRNGTMERHLSAERTWSHLRHNLKALRK